MNCITFLICAFEMRNVLFHKRSFLHYTFYRKSSHSKQQYWNLENKWGLHRQQTCPDLSITNIYTVNTQISDKENKHYMTAKKWKK